MQFFLWKCTCCRTKRKQSGNGIHVVEIRFCYEMQMSRAKVVPANAYTINITLQCKLELWNLQLNIALS